MDQLLSFLDDKYKKETAEKELKLKNEKLKEEESRKLKEEENVKIRAFIERLKTKTELSQKLYDLAFQYGDEDDYSRDFDYFVETKILFEELKSLI
jgi:hypothetical protein